MNKYAECDSLTLGLRGLVLMADNAPVDVAGFARLNGLSEKQARGLMRTYEKCGYARRTSQREIYVPTQLAIELVGQVGPADRLN
ncbi:hypothetical protein [Sphingobium aromaticivastans]|uniref:hypothetical protein n=1 Tax=Sphingobium aromaticivastans TaxID=1778665 RepID=UPI00301A7B2A